MMPKKHRSDIQDIRHVGRGAHVPGKNCVCFCVGPSIVILYIVLGRVWGNHWDTGHTIRLQDGCLYRYIYSIVV